MGDRTGHRLSYAEAKNVENCGGLDSNVLASEMLCVQTIKPETKDEHRPLRCSDVRRPVSGLTEKLLM